MQSISQTKAATMCGHVWGAPTVYMELLDNAKGYLWKIRKKPEGNNVNFVKIA